MMKDDNEDDLKNKEDLHRWKAHGAGHIPLCGIFLRVLVIVEGYYLAYGPHIGPAIKWKGLV